MAGRPTKYSAALQRKADAYVDGGWKKCGDVVPSIAGLSVEIGINRETAHAWAKDENKPAFSNTLKRMAAIQERESLSGGLSGKFNPTITKLLLHNHGYSDKSDHTVGSPDGGPLAITIQGVPGDAPR